MDSKSAFSTTIRIEIPPEAIPGPSGKAGKHTMAQARTRPHANSQVKAVEGGVGESKYRQLLQSIYDAAIIASLDGQIVDVNQRAEEFFLYEPEQLCAMNVLQLVSGADRSLLEDLTRHLQQERFALIQAYGVRQNEGFFPAEIAVNLLQFEEKRLCFLVRDVTVRKQAEEMLRTEHNAIQNAGNGIAIADVKGQIESVNPAVLRLWGYEAPEDVLHLNLRELWSDPAQADDMMRSILDEHMSWSGEVLARRKDGTSFYTQVSAACNRDSEGVLTGIVISFTDITDRMLAEDAMKESERQKAMLATLGATCHHLGQPATVILANMGLMARKIIPNDHELKRLIQNTTAAAEELGKMLYQLNTMAEYRTTSYLEGGGHPRVSGNDILDIGSNPS